MVKREAGFVRLPFFYLHSFMNRKGHLTTHKDKINR